MTKEKSGSKSEAFLVSATEGSTARTGTRTLPLLPASATDDAVALALKERGLSRDVYDFIAHNWGKASALVAALSAESAQ